MPRCAVLREDGATSGLGLVFGALSHGEGCPSLGDCLLTGPSLDPSLLNVLVKFRLHQMAFAANITEAFLQMALAVRDKGAVGILWLHAPLKKMTLPHVELMGALIGARLANTPLKPLKMEKTHLHM